MADEREDLDPIRLPAEYADLIDVVQAIRAMAPEHERDILAGKLMNVARRIESDTRRIDSTWDQVTRLAVANGELASVLVPLIVERGAAVRLRLMDADIAALAHHFRDAVPEALPRNVRNLARRCIGEVFGPEDADAWDIGAMAPDMKGSTS